MSLHYVLPFPSCLLTFLILREIQDRHAFPLVKLLIASFIGIGPIPAVKPPAEFNRDRVED